MKYKIKDVPGFTAYLADTNGVIFRKMIVKGRIVLKIITPRVNNRGYYRVALADTDGNNHELLVHRVIASVFLRNPQNLKTVNHKDGYKYNNSVSNLEWMSLTDNISHAYANGLHYRNNYDTISDELKSAISNEYHYGNCDRKYIARKYGVTSRILLDLLGPYDKHFRIDRTLKNVIENMYTGSRGDIKKISKETGLSVYMVRGYLRRHKKCS